MGLDRAIEVLKELWDTYGVAIEKEYSLFSLSNERVIEEFFFVVLGGFGISYELNKSGLDLLKKKGLINVKYYSSVSNLDLTEMQLREEFSKKQFSPLTNNGQYRKYRYVESKPRIITAAGHWLWNVCNWKLYDKLSELESTSSRSWLCQCPGIGMKSASWLLRNTGFNDDCAVLDIHILRFLNYLGIVVPNYLTEKDYMQVEEILRRICFNIGVSLGKIDYLLWMLGRNGYLNYAR